MSCASVRPLTISLGLSLLFLAFFWFALPKSPVQALDGYSVYYAAPVCAGVPTPCFTSIQAAVDAADEPADVIKVAAGTYTDLHMRPRNDIETTGVVTQIVYISKTLTIQGGYTTANWTTPDPDINLTTLDAQGKGRVLYIDGNISPKIEGFSVTGGNAAGMAGPGPASPWHEYGGGIYVITASVTLKNNRIFSNTAFAGGGGVYIWNSGGTLLGNTVSSNTVAAGSAGVNVNVWGDVDLVIISNIFRGNTYLLSNEPGGGGALWVGGGRALIADNYISDNRSKGAGAAVEMGHVTAALLRNRVFGNQGAGISVVQANLHLENNFVANNTGISVGGVSGYLTDAILTNNVIAGNRPIGMDVSFSHIVLSHTTFVDNGDYAVLLHGTVGSTLDFVNSIIACHQIGVDAYTATLTGTLWYSNTQDWITDGTIITGTHNYWGEPDFWDPDRGNYRLRPTSAAIDRGIDAGVYSDFDGLSRPLGNGFDLGAFEYVVIRLYVPILYKN